MWREILHYSTEEDGGKPEKEVLLFVFVFTEQGGKDCCGEKIISNVQPLSAPSAPFASVASFPSGPKYLCACFSLFPSISFCLPPSPSLEEAQAADLQPPSCWCQLNKPVSFMQYAEENRHPLTTEPASQDRAAAA